MLAVGAALVCVVAVFGWLTWAYLERLDERARAARSPRAVFIAQLRVSPVAQAREYAVVLSRRAPRPDESFVDLERDFREYLISETGTTQLAITPRYHPVRR